MGLVGDWQQLEAGLPDTWEAAGVYLTLEEARELDRAVVLLAPLQPVRAGAGAISLRVSRAGTPGPEAMRRGMLRLDGERIHGTLATDEIVAGPEPRAEAPRVTLAESWDAALAALPADWSDLLGEIELDSSDYVEPSAIQLAPINPRRVGVASKLQFRSASRFGYGASPGMVRRCLERCDGIGIRGRVHVLRALSDSHPVGTQGPVWQIEGRFV
jgi:hypothetical protein